MSLAKPGGYVRIFLDEGAPMARLLDEAVSRGIEPDYARQLLLALPSYEPEQIGRSPTQPPPSGMVEPLTERELQILRLPATRLTSTEIVEELCITANTVRYHIQNIYGKLAVHRRVDAVDRAKELGML